MGRSGERINWRQLLNIKQDSGYTLLEVLAAASVLVIAFGSIYALYIHPIASLESAREDYMQLHLIQVLYWQLAQDMANVVAPSLLRDVEFTGTGSTIGFYMMSDASEPFYVRYTVVDDGDVSLVRIAGTSGNMVENKHAIASCENVCFSYYDNEYEIWRDAWDSSLLALMPSAVRIDFKITDDRGTDAFSMVFPINVSRKIRSETL